MSYPTHKLPTGTAEDSNLMELADPVSGKRYKITQAALKAYMGGSATIGGTYDNNADAVTILGVGKLYKSSTLINGSPIILITI